MADAAIALFWTRLGTPTNEFDSGTAEEIQRLHGLGKPVAILRCERNPSIHADPGQLTELDRYLKSIDKNAFIKSFANDGDLKDELNVTLDWLAKNRRPALVDSTINAPPAEPRSQVTAFVRSGGTHRKALVFVNHGSLEADSISWELVVPDGVIGKLPGIATSNGRPSDLIPALGPRGAEYPYPMNSSGETAQQILCRMQWKDSDGNWSSETTIRR